MRDTAVPTSQPALVTAVSGSTVTLQQLHVLLPSPASGTRQFFLLALGIRANTTASWTNDNNEENHADVLTEPGDIIPFSVPPYIQQFNGLAPDTGVRDPDFHLDSLRLGVNPDGTGGTVEAPVDVGDGAATAGPLFGDPSVPPDGAVGTFDRDVYSVVPTVVITADFATDPEFADTPTNEAYAAAVKQLVTVTLPESQNIVDFGFEQISYSAGS